MTTHEFDACYAAQVCNSQDRAVDNSFLLAEQERDFYAMESERVATLKRQGAIEALHNLTITLSQLILRENVQGDYLFGLYEAFQVVNGKLGLAKGGVV